jgi:hypothetical protein
MLENLDRTSPGIGIIPRRGDGGVTGLKIPDLAAERRLTGVQLFFGRHRVWISRLDYAKPTPIECDFWT